MCCRRPCELSGPHLGEELHKSVRGRGEERKKGGWEEATERGIVSSHCSIKSVGNDQD